MKDLHKVSTCSSCKYVFTKHEYEEGPSYYCTLDAPPRPLCGSVLMKESFGGISLSGFATPSEAYEERRSNFREALKVWQSWSKEREVQANTVCNQYEKEVPNDT